MAAPPPVYSEAVHHPTVATGWEHEPPVYGEQPPPSYDASSHHASNVSLRTAGYAQSPDPGLRSYPPAARGWMPVPAGRKELDELWMRSGCLTDTSVLGVALRDSGLEVRQDASGYALVKTLGVPDYLPQNASGGQSIVVNNWRGYSRSGKWDGNPNQCASQDFLYCFNLRSATPMPVSVDTPLGPIGIALNGIPLYNWKTSGDRDAVQVESFDICAGHPDGKGRYHYHQFPRCVKTASSLGNKASETLATALARGAQSPWDAKPLIDALRTQIQNGIPSAPVGILFDGYILYGPVGQGAGGPVRLLRSSYVNGRYQPQAGDLDECNGATGPDGIYRYYCTVTFDNNDLKPTFPYLPPKFHGQPEPRNFPPHALRSMGIRYHGTGPSWGGDWGGGGSWWF